MSRSSGESRRREKWFPCASPEAVCRRFSAMRGTGSILPDRTGLSGGEIWCSISGIRGSMSCTGSIRSGGKNIICWETPRPCVEGPLRREQIFALIVQVKRKGKILRPGNFLVGIFRTRMDPYAAPASSGLPAVRCFLRLSAEENSTDKIVIFTRECAILHCEVK